ncbi:MAG: hypothetical protein IBX47_01400 [Desulfuromonadales bacterium]|nr:hypothetical protein [Desulfuromonadales bacterium]
MERAPIQRTLLLLIFVLLLMSGKAQAGFFFSDYRPFEICTTAMVITAEKLKEDSKSSELHYNRIRPGGDSTDERMLRRLGMSGAIFATPIFEPFILSDDTPVRFTGTVYKYRPGMLHRVLGGSREQIFYEVELLGEMALLHAGSFREPPLPICDEAMQ